MRLIFQSTLKSTINSALIHIGFHLRKQSQRYCLLKPEVSLHIVYKGVRGLYAINKATFELTRIFQFFILSCTFSP